MTSGTQTRFTIDINGTCKAILSVGNRTEGGIGVNLLPAKYFRSPGTLLNEVGADDMHKKVIKNQYYSVHPTVESKTKNAITHTIIFDDKTNFKTSHYTEALKVHNQYAWIFSRRFGDLKNKEYDIGKVKNIPGISLGRFDDSKFTLVFSVFVSKSCIKFKTLASDLNVTHTSVAGFTITVVWSFISLPSHRANLFLHNVNFRIKIYQTTRT